MPASRMQNILVYSPVILSIYFKFKYRCTMIACKLLAYVLQYLSTFLKVSMPESQVDSNTIKCRRDNKITLLKIIFYDNIIISLLFIMRQ